MFFVYCTSNSTGAKGFCQVKKIQKSEKNSEVGGWVKPQLGFFFFDFLCFLCCFHVSNVKKKIKNWIGVGG